ncbi:MAG: GNAT family N-acetyltransferase [candidate division Zixibacteria bacterium]|nr:GNAT family N-acetyltransferase [candidate division Zixibacteria bacterium]
MKVYRTLVEQLAGEDSLLLTNGPFFTSPGFAFVWESHGGTPVVWIAEEDGEIVALLPGVEYGRRPMVRFMSMPNGCYGGLVLSSKDGDNKQELGRLLLAAIADYHYATTHIYDFRSNLPSDNRFKHEPCQTSLVDISDPDWQPPDKKLRQQIRKAEKEGIEVIPFSGDTHMSGFLDLVSIFEQRTGQKCKYSPEFFSAMAVLAAGDDRVRWFWCEFEGHPVSSNIFIVNDDQLLHWQAYFDEAYSFLHPSKYIPYYAARNAVGHDLKYLNLGASPEDVPGVASYKAKWGGVVYQYNCLIRQKGLGRFL